MGFEGEWEEEEIGFHYDFKNGLNKGKEYFGYGTPIVNFTDVYNKRGITSDELKGRVNLKQSEIENFKVNQGDIFFTRTSETIEEIGFPSVMLDSPIDTVFSGFVLRARAIDKDPLALLFKQYAFYTDSFRSEMIKKSSMTTRALTSGTAINKMKFHYPANLLEQSKIGAFFQKVDSLITLHQRKHDKLTTVKKAMLEKMFPKEGADVPEVRFKEFTEPWKEKKLNDIANKVIEKNASKEYVETFTNSAEFGIISQRDYFDKDISNSENIGGYYIVRPGDFVYNPRISTLAPVGPVNLNKIGRTGIMSPLYTVFRTKNINNIFLDYFFKTERWHPFMFYHGDTGARADRFSIKDSVFIELPIPYPSVQEQLKIGTYFFHLDSLITLQLRELDKLKSIKKACLDKMFV